MYGSVAMRWNYCLEELAASHDKPWRLGDRGSTALSAAGSKISTLKAYCDGFPPQQGDGYAAWYAKRMAPFASNLEASTDFLQAILRGEDQVPWSGDATANGYPPPELAYSYGCSAALVRDFGGTGRDPKELFDDFAFAIATDADRTDLLRDPAYQLLKAASNSDDLDTLLKPGPAPAAQEPPGAAGC